MDGPQSHSGRFGELNLLTIHGFDPRIYQAVAQSLYLFSIPNLSVNYFNIFRSFDALCVLNSFLQFIDVIGLWGGGMALDTHPLLAPKLPAIAYYGLTSIYLYLYIYTLIA